ncbi:MULTISPECIES: oligosaccharyl transferase, archaeosortase A system-associated [Methanosarcina]|uniref:dolichyl-phosphooligosaccharide-protein glycotransferase n=1 Tax=Methanosarcina barkeri CM1 TaxID=796385 RepID=A0A0G3CJ79_METBA|nr:MULTISPECIES: oligosaccharyl transferase, archaeosortase A system-associated [Methanosarcina]AKJ39132.1 oligosaccharyl transferase [Methanosarcina barkeri CM1]OED02478.1 peptide transporter [Methanosarcina sp. A14]
MITTNKGMGCPVAKRPAHKLKFSIISLIAVGLVAFLMRLISYSTVTANGSINLLGYDSFYHMRRILYTTFNFPHPLNFDSYINYPAGFEVGWPPFFDFLGALLAKVLGGGNPDLYTTEFAGALLPVLLGVLTIIPLYMAAAAIFDRKTALFGALVFAVIPAHVYVSRFGAVDHHVAETLLSTSAYACFILALKWAREGSLSLTSLKNISSEKKLIKSLAFAVASGLFFALLIYTWIGALVFVSFIVLYAFIQTIIDLKAEKNSDYLLICSTVSLLATLLFTIPLSAGSLRPGLEMSAMYLSWFQVFYVFSMLVGTLILWGFSLYISKKGLDWKYYPAVLILISVAGLLFLKTFSAESYAFVIEGMNFFLGKGEYISTISEALPVFLTSDGNLTFTPILGSLGLCFLTALGGFFLLGLEWRGEKSKPEGVFFLLWSAFFAYLMLSQRRFSYLFAVNAAMLTSYLLWVLLDSFDFETEVKKLVKSVPTHGNNAMFTSRAEKETKSKKSEKETKSKTKSKSKINSSGSKQNSQPDYFKIVSSLALIGLVFIPCIWAGVAFAKEDGLIDPIWKDSLTWLGASSPETSYYLDPSGTPEYGVLSWWDYGNWIVYQAKRPAVSNNFQTGVDDSSHFFLTNSEEDAKAIMEKLKVKYVITDNLMAGGKFGSIVKVAGENISKYLNVQTVNGNGGLQTIATAKKEYTQTEVYKLHQLDGSNLGNLRLVHETTAPEVDNDTTSDVKIFEFVSGARLSGTADPGQSITATLELRSNTGRKFTYQNEVTSDKNGSFEITVPYSTENKADGVNALSTYSLKAGNTTVSEIQVTEKDVLEGNRVEVKIPESK